MPIIRNYKSPIPIFYSKSEIGDLNRNRNITNFKRPLETIKDLAKYLNVEISDEDIGRLITFVAFDNMKDMRKADLVPSDYFKPGFEFFNKGKIGNWKKHISEEQSKRIDEVVAKNLKYKKPIQYEPTVKN